VNSGEYQDDASISADGLTLYYHADRSGRLEIWQVRRASPTDPWGEPISLGDSINAGLCSVGPDISADGLSLYFARHDCNNLDTADLYVATRATTTAPWQDPEPLGSIVNGPFLDGQPSISSDGLTLYFTSTRPGGFGAADIYVTTRSAVSDPWGSPVNVGPTINSWIDELAPEINADSSALYFYQGEYFTGRYVPFDIMETPLKASPWRTETLIPTATEWRFFRGTQEPSKFPDQEWTRAGFDDGAWREVGRLWLFRGSAARIYWH